MREGPGRASRRRDDQFPPGSVRLDELNPTEWDRLVREYQPRLERYARSRGVGEPEDLAQDVLRALTERAGEFGGRAELESWLFTVAFRRAADWHRYRFRHPAASMEGVDVPSSAPDPSAIVCESETVTEALTAMAALSERERSVLDLRIHGELDAASTGSVLGMSATHVRVVQTRALAKLRARLSTTVRQDLRSATGLPAMFTVSGWWRRITRATEPAQSIVQGGIGMAVITATAVTVSVAAVGAPPVDPVANHAAPRTMTVVGTRGGAPATTAERPALVQPAPSTTTVPEPTTSAPSPTSTTTTTRPQDPPPEVGTGNPKPDTTSTGAAGQVAASPDPAGQETAPLGVDLDISDDEIDAGLEADLGPVGSAEVTASLDEDGAGATVDAAVGGTPLSTEVEVDEEGVAMDAAVAGLDAAVTAAVPSDEGLQHEVRVGDELVPEPTGDLVSGSIGGILDR